MELRTYRASSMQEALMLVRQDLGPSAAVVHTREVGAAGLMRFVRGPRGIEVTASREVNVPSRLAAAEPASPAPRAVASPFDYGPEQSAQFHAEVRGQLSDLQQMVETLSRRTKVNERQELPEAFFRLYAELIDADIADDEARDLVERVRQEMPEANEAAYESVRLKAQQVLETQIRITGPIVTQPGRRRLVALVGPTGVGKTTTIAKLAANFRLRAKRRVGLITVDTYRIAAVEQLRTYADIIDLPMQVVSTPREMREAVAKMSDLDLILLDTAGRSPRDEVQIQELKSFLTEAQADEVHLVMSSVCSSSTLLKTSERFTEVGATSLLITKLDEASSFGNLWPLLRSCPLPLSYLTDGQNVPDDIQPADRRRLARLVLGQFEESPASL
jgi:flagellar biosynthesis protein FlhF